jgi:hypothetical protein
MHRSTALEVLGLSFLIVILSACVGNLQSQPDAAAPVSPSPVPTDSASEESVTEAPPGAVSEFSTDFSKNNVDLGEVISGGPPKDGIPSIDSPKFVSVGDADAWLGSEEAIILLELNGQARAYPLQILMWHEIVNDEIGETPVAVTYCPLCNTAIAFKAEIDGRRLDFGTTGRLRYSNLIMYDRQTETWWQQATGEAVAGELTGERLPFLPATLIPWSTFKANYPEGRVLSRQTGAARNYGGNPYDGYDTVGNQPFLYTGPDVSEALPDMARVLGVEHNGEAVAYPYPVLGETRVVNDRVGEASIVVFWEPGTASALDASKVAEGRDVGSAAAYARQLGDRTLTFRFDGEQIVDEETGSHWNLLGEATAGPLVGEELTPVIGNYYLWFAWWAFRPDARLYEGE